MNWLDAMKVPITRSGVKEDARARSTPAQPTRRQVEHVAAQDHAANLQGDLRRALTTVKFRVCPREFFQAVYCGRAPAWQIVFARDLVKLRAAYDANPNTLFVYRGVQPSRKTRKASDHFHINPFGIPFVLQARPGFKTAGNLTDKGVTVFLVK